MTTKAKGRTLLLDTIETQRLGCQLAGSPLYADVLEAVAADVVVGGPSAAILDPVAEAPFGDAILLRFLAALHRAVLAGDAPALAMHYPSAGGTPHAGLAGALRATVVAHAVEITAQLGCGVQTNEVGRSAALVGGYLELARLGLPLHLLEVGSSAGLNLNVDRYRYEAGGRSFGPADSPLVFREPWLGSSAPDLGLPLVIGSRLGCDAAPIDATTPEGRLRLRSFVWPDQADRLARLDAALLVAERHPPIVVRSDAVAWLATQLAAPVVGACIVVAHSIVLQYLSPGARADFLAILDGAGRRATSDAPLAWLRLEPGGEHAELRLTTWPGGQTRQLATSAYHGPPVAWRVLASGDRPGTGS
ncbi:MAG: hypothetical protein JWM89_3719 [Acidimicrobiales bacterium]|nr:hypothetical protein [Acidimicrobiales bacterium]